MRRPNQRPRLSLACLLLLACGGEDPPTKSADAGQGPRDSGAADGSHGSDAGTPSGARDAASDVTQTAHDSSAPADDAATPRDDAGTDVDAGVDAGAGPAPRTDYEQLADEACQMAGGQCLSVGECLQGGATVEGLTCRPGFPGLSCCRKPPACEGYGTAGCCETSEGQLVASGIAGCDRGYLSCAGRPTAFISKTQSCSTAASTHIATTAESAVSKWEGAKSVTEAGRWACTQAGGRDLSYDQACDGFSVALSATGFCCIPRALCHEANEGTECCEQDGKLRAKECIEGTAQCNGALLQLGTMREVKLGTCKPF